LRTLDLFCGAGLSSAGARSAGAELVAGVDQCPLAAETYSQNFSSALVVNKPLEKIAPAKLRDKIGDIDLLLASPECTNHTCAKGSAPRSEESRATAMQIVRYARTFKPRWIVMENVVHMRPWPRYVVLIETLRRMGYRIREQVLDAASFGVPQKRRRLFVICDREAEPAEISPGANKASWVRDVLDPDDIWEMTALFKKGRARDTKARARRAIAALGQWNSFLIVYYGTDGCGGWQPLDRPLRTITTIDRFALVRPSVNGYRMRMLQVPELQRAMGASPEFCLTVGTRRDKIKLLGNGVCPPVMENIVTSLRASA
jgi:DNA (cytosine-5)-methyltransferase 1